MTPHPPVIKSGTRFIVTDEHLTLLRAANVHYHEEGSFWQDPKRPYGNSCPIPEDVYRVLMGHDYYTDHEDSDGLDEDNEELYDHYMQLHMDMAVVLQIVLDTGKFERGTYQFSWGHPHWEKIEIVAF